MDIVIETGAGSSASGGKTWVHEPFWNVHVYVVPHRVPDCWSWTLRERTTSPAEASPVMAGANRGEGLRRVETLVHWPAWKIQVSL